MDALAIIMRLGQGHLLEELADALQRTADEVVKTAQPGQVTLTLKVLPPTLTIAIPVLKGHAEYDEDGKASPVLYRLTVRLRVSVGDDARLAFRLSLPDAERVLEAVYEDRVKAARQALGADFSILRATA